MKKVMAEIKVKKSRGEHGAVLFELPSTGCAAADDLAERIAEAALCSDGAGLLCCRCASAEAEDGLVSVYFECTRSAGRNLTALTCAAFCLRCDEGTAVTLSEAVATAECKLPFAPDGFYISGDALTFFRTLPVPEGARKSDVGSFLQEYEVEISKTTKQRLINGR